MAADAGGHRQREEDTDEPRQLMAVSLTKSTRAADRTHGSGPSRACVTALR